MVDMKKRLIMIGVFAACFFLSMIITSILINKGSSDLTVEMGQAVLPVIYVMEENEYVNLHRGYTGDMSGNYVRGSLSPLSEGRILPIRIDTFGTAISQIGYEVRSMDMGRLVEDQVLTGYSGGDNMITADIAIKDLITPGVEYMLIMKLTLYNGVMAKYYIRFIESEDMGLKGKLSFVRDFSDRTLDKNRAEELKKYMESNAEGDNSSFGYVNIHSSFDQLTWGELEPKPEGEKELYILEADSNNASIKLEYKVSTGGELYRVNEFFRIKEGAERMYLMEYERTMDQLITDEEGILVNGKLIHGILNDPVKHLENEDGSVYCFMQQDTLYSYNTINGNLSRVFSFRSFENDDVRTEYGDHDIVPMSIDEQGNITFLVFGYMNRGRHEGEEGILLYYYDSVFNSIEEQLFIPYDKSFEILDYNMSILSHLNFRNSLFLYLDGTIYRMRTDTAEARVIAGDLDENRFFANKDGNMIAWQPGVNVYDYNSIKLMSLDDERTIDIEAEGAELLLPLGFIGEDLIYGKVRRNEIAMDSSGSMITPMYEICIVDPRGNVLREHRRDGYYFMSIEVNDNIINLDRSVRGEDGELIPADSEQILSNERTVNEINVYTSVVTEDMETTWQTVLKNPGSGKGIRVLTPKEAMNEENVEVQLSGEDSFNRFYIYHKGLVDSVYTTESSAVRRADEIAANIVDKRCAYIYEALNRQDSVRLEGFDETGEEEGGSEEEGEEGTDSLILCLDAMLKYEGVYEDPAKLSQSGNAMEVLQNALVEKLVLNLTGASPQSVLYYVSCGHPVLAFTEETNAVLIIGYDSKNMIIYDPEKGKPYKAGMNDSTEYFETCGNRFISYVD